jgi:hypothetical protein
MILDNCVRNFSCIFHNLSYTLSTDSHWTSCTIPLNANINNYLTKKNFYLILFLIAFFHQTIPKALTLWHKLKKHVPNHQNKPIPMQLLANQNEYKVHLQEIGSNLIQHHISNCKPTQIRLNQ